MTPVTAHGLLYYITMRFSFFKFKTLFSPAVCVGILSLLTVGAIVLAFPATHGALQHWGFNGAVWALLVLLAAVTVRALFKRRILSALFHLGMIAVILGGATTAWKAVEEEKTLIDSPMAPRFYREWTVNGESCVLESFRIDRYENGMPKQYITRLAFPEGSYELSVNQPLRRKGITYYQMSYTQATDPMGGRAWATVLTARRDPGVPWVFAAYGIFLLATLTMAVREEVRHDA